MCAHAQTPYHPSVRPCVCLCTCKSVHMHTSPRLYVVCMYVCNHEWMCVCGCVRACVCVCFCTQIFKYIHAIFHRRANVRPLACMFADMHVCMCARSCKCARACMRTCSGVHVHILCEAFAYIRFVHAYARTCACARPIYSLFLTSNF